MDLSARDAWIFDLDGTLTVAVHDFDAIRAELGLPAGQPILEELAAMEPARAERLHRQLYAIEHALAREARPAPGAERLLTRLASRGTRLGLLTRNSVELARLTLAACGLGGAFEPRAIVGRESGPPKPDPAGVHALLDTLGAGPERAVVVGDYLFDLQAGRAAGAATVWVDLVGDGRYAGECDLVVRGLDELTGRLTR